MIALAYSSLRAYDSHKAPFLFLIYINDISNNLVNNTRLFADDTSLFIVVDNYVDSSISFTANLDKIDTWALDCNPNKCVI